MLTTKSLVSFLPRIQSRAYVYQCMYHQWKGGAKGLYLWPVAIAPRGAFFEKGKDSLSSF